MKCEIKMLLCLRGGMHDAVSLVVPLQTSAEFCHNWARNERGLEEKNHRLFRAKPGFRTNAALGGFEQETCNTRLPVYSSHSFGVTGEASVHLVLRLKYTSSLKLRFRPNSNKPAEQSANRKPRRRLTSLCGLSSMETSAGMPFRRRTSDFTCKSKAGRRAMM